MSDMTQNEEWLRDQLEEALRCLARATGCRWDSVLKSRASLRIISMRCGVCAGEGSTNHWGPISGDWTETCEICAGQGIVLMDNPKYSPTEIHQYTEIK